MRVLYVLNCLFCRPAKYSVYRNVLPITEPKRVLKCTEPQFLDSVILSDGG